MSDRDRIRAAELDDAVAVAEIYRPVVESTTISFEAVAPTDVEMQDRIAETIHQYPWLVFERAGEVVGYAYGARHRARTAYQWSVDTSVYVDARHRGMGVGRRLYAALFELLSAQGFANAYAGIALPNLASVALHERMGFRSVGVFPRVGFKFGTWCDVGWWHRPLAEIALKPELPTPFAQLSARPEWQKILRP